MPVNKKRVINRDMLRCRRAIVIIDESFGKLKYIVEYVLMFEEKLSESQVKWRLIIYNIVYISFRQLGIWQN